MKIILDVATPKHAIFAAYLEPIYRRKGFDVEILARESTQTLKMLRYFKLDYKVIGYYGGMDLTEKYIATLDNEINLLKHILEFGEPDILWSHGNVAGIRTAFHMGIPVIHVNDTPYNIPVAKLTVPLSTKLVTPAAWSISDWSRFGIDPGDIIRYYGIEEVAWIRRMDVDREKIRSRYLDRDERIIVFRMIEYKASYSLNVKPPIYKVLEKLSRYAKIIYIPRYEEELKLASKIPNTIILRDVVFAPELIAASDINLNSGGTMAREGALLGVPTISYYFYNKITRFLIKHRLPIWYIPDIDKIIRKTIKILRDPDKYRIDSKEILNKFDDPLEVIIDTTLDILKQ
ncbi:hypothetical protein DRN84_02890 [Candidatus Geothermarchaeota archaeon]|nr:MAG: hypothetical protein DRN84_02890 [Candidatus Geothermarchaeota archaeon]